MGLVDWLIDSWCVDDATGGVLTDWSCACVETLAACQEVMSLPGVQMLFKHARLTLYPVRMRVCGVIHTTTRWR